MPPPTISDQWLASRRFGIVIDAGSSGSRVQVYSWKDARAVKADIEAHESNASLLDTLPRVEKGVQSGDGWLRKVEPGLSTFGNDPTSVWDYLTPLLEHAQAIVPPSLHRETPLFLLATAGMRLLDSNQQTAIIEATCSFFRTRSSFRLGHSSTMGPCGSSVRIISGEEEGLFGWIAVNYLMDGFSSHEQNHRATYGFLDMGGASTQIAFEPSEKEKANLSTATSDALVEVRLRLLGGEEIRHRVFVTTWLGYGTNQARERYLGQEVEEWDAHSDHTPEAAIPDPCLPKHLTLSESPIPDNSPSDSHSRKPHQFVGTGSFPECVKETAPLLNKTVPCPDTSCLFNGVPAPSIDFSLSKFIGVSEYWYSSEHVFGLGGAYDFVEYERAATQFCSREWNDIVDEHADSRLYLDGTLVEDGGEVFRWGKEVGLNRLKMQCFKAAWIVNVLHEGIGMPRIIDAGGNSTSHEVDQAPEKAHNKNLGEIVKPLPAFQSVDTIGDTAISWTLGKMVLEASKEVPATSYDSSPLSDPDPHHQGAIEQTPFKDGRQHGLSIGALFPVVLVLVGAIFFLLRALLRMYIRRTRKVADGEERIGLFDYHSSEENGGGSFSSSSSGSPPSTPHARRVSSHGGILRSIRRFVRSIGAPRRPNRPKSRSDATKPRLFTQGRPPPRHNSLPSPVATNSFFQLAPARSTSKLHLPPHSSQSAATSRAPSRTTSAMGFTAVSRPAAMRSTSSILPSPTRSFSATFPSRPTITPTSISIVSSRPSSSDSELESPDADDEEPMTARPSFGFLTGPEQFAGGLVVPNQSSSRSSPQNSPYGDLSRNSSQVNLTTAVPRNAGLARTPTRDEFGDTY
ncbi:hypothetical protein DL93DRAFT_2151666 [Clavulina sp. PMI_390]|nr:hypothetical protein DL93DRAFT_2151666 [Clavulina sp. PMI_390]